MKHNLYILETAKNNFISLEQTGYQELDAIPVEEYCEAQRFNNEKEVDMFVQIINNGESSNSCKDEIWKVAIPKSLLPVRKRILLVELMSE